MIVNTGQRTDIPAFYSDWLMRRIREGFVLVRNPFNPQAVTRYELRPDLVDLIGFCTKNPAPMLPHVPLLDKMGFGQFWYVSITPYGRDIEPGVPDKHRTLEVFKTLSSLVGVQRVGWRYDPVLINGRYTADYHRRAFRTMAEELEGFTDKCVLSFVQLYPKLERNFPGLEEAADGEKISLAGDLMRIADDHGIRILPCGMGRLLEPLGAGESSCMSPALYEAAAGARLSFPRYKGQREGCCCYLSCDIGAYSSCGHLCRYCYANASPGRVRGNMRRHDPASPLIIGGLESGDKIHQAEQRSWKGGGKKEEAPLQGTLF